MIEVISVYKTNKKPVSCILYEQGQEITFTLFDGKVKKVLVKKWCNSFPNIKKMFEIATAILKGD